MNVDEIIRTTASRIGASVTCKLITIGILILVLLLPVSMVQSLIREREHRQREVVEEINAKWGQAQVVTGPVMTVPYYRTVVDEQRKYTRVIHHLHVLPDTLRVQGKVTPHRRYRGIYEAVLYETQLVLEGKFSRPKLDDVQVPASDILWEEAFVAIGITDMRGIRSAIAGKFNGSDLSMEPGLQSGGVLASGVGAKVDLSGSEPGIAFRFAVDLNGSQELSFVPIGRTTEVALASPWMDPSFSGAFLPVERTVDATGFTARWNVLHLNRNYPQVWTGNGYAFDDSVFGVRLFNPVDVYQKTMRTAKYALLFIMFAFMAFFLSEILHRRRVHPVQYLLVGLAIVIFYTLLLSISEHLTFGRAYLIASVAVVVLVAVYAWAVMQRIRVAAMVGGILAILYSYLYILLQLTDYALLMGSIGLFVLLALVMHLTRWIDWYGLSAPGGDAPALLADSGRQATDSRA